MNAPQGSAGQDTAPRWTVRHRSRWTIRRPRTQPACSFWRVLITGRSAYPGFFFFFSFFYFFILNQNLYLFSSKMISKRFFKCTCQAATAPPDAFQIGNCQAFQTLSIWWQFNHTESCISATIELFFYYYLCVLLVTLALNWSHSWYNDAR